MEKKKVLVIEDTLMNMKLISAVLELGNYVVFQAENAEDGIEMAYKYHPDIILMDLQLPGMDGLSATKLIKSDPELKSIPVIAVTSFAMVGDHEKAMEAGCSGHISKPIDTRSFIETMEKIVTETKAA